MAGQAVRIRWDAAAERRFRQAVERGFDSHKVRTRAQLQRAALEVQNYARQYAPVDTGRLRSSIAADEVQDTGRGLSVSIGTNVEYAPYVEFGTRHSAAQPFLRPAFLAVLSSLRRRL